MKKNKAKKIKRYITKTVLGVSRIILVGRGILTLIQFVLDNH